MKPRQNWTNEQLAQAVAQHINIKSVVITLGIKGNRNNCKRTLKKIVALGLDTSHWKRGQDWTGRKLHNLTFIAPSNQTKRGGTVMWEVECDCGNKAVVIPSDVSRGHRRSCGCLKDQARKRAGEAGRLYHPKISTARSIWRANYKELDFDIWLDLVQKPCYYCGRDPFRTYNANQRDKHYNSEYQKKEGNFTCHGLDRIDSSKGHTPDNVVSCCTRCNWMKSDMSVEEFYAHIRLVCAHIGFTPQSDHTSDKSQGQD